MTRCLHQTLATPVMLNLCVSECTGERFGPSLWDAAIHLGHQQLKAPAPEALISRIIAARAYETNECVARRSRAPSHRLLRRQLQRTRPMRIYRARFQLMRSRDAFFRSASSSQCSPELPLSHDGMQEFRHHLSGDPSFFRATAWPSSV